MMATREPRYTKFRIGWHREEIPDGTPSWWAEIGGTKVAGAVMTGRNGVDDYPWDWYLNENGEGMRLAGRGRRSSGVTDTLRAAKAEVLELLEPR